MSPTVKEKGIFFIDQFDVDEDYRPGRVPGGSAGGGLLSVRLDDPRLHL